MSNTLPVQWTITPRTAPQPRLNCSRCRGPRCFRSSGKIRVNANGRRIDAWLIYRCTACDDSWNRPIVERREVSGLDRRFLRSLQANDPDLVRTLAFDVTDLRRSAGRVEEFDDVLVSKRVLSESVGPIARVEIECLVPRPIGLRADRLLASELELSRGAVQRLARAGQILTDPPGLDLRRPPRDGLRLIIDARSMAERCIRHAAGPHGPPRPA